MWTSVEVELKEKLADLQVRMKKCHCHFIIELTYNIILLQNKLCRILQATQKSQNHAIKLNHGALESLESVVGSIEHESESENEQSGPNELKRK
jgi:hypothetical protein